MKKNKILPVICITMATCIFMCAIAYAAANKEIKALLRQDIKVKTEGTVQVLKDDKGKALYPISYNGNTYVPVNSICKILGTTVRWDPTTKTYFVGPENLQPKSVLKFKSKTSDYSSKVTDKGSLTIEGSDGSGTTFKDGIYFDVWNSACSSSIDRAYQANINGEYTKLSFDAYVTEKKGDNSGVKFKVYVYNVDTGETIANIQVEAGEVKHVEDIDITGIKNIGFASDCTDYTHNGDAFFFNPTVQ